VRRREFITLLGSTAAWPMAARGQQAALPAIGFLNSASPDKRTRLVDAFRQGLSETGYVEGRKVIIEYRWAEGQSDRLPALAADLVARQVAVIAATDNSASLAAKLATTTIPIVCLVGLDPVQFGLVASLSQPGGNVTGITSLDSDLEPKQLQLLQELIPKATKIGFLVNPNNPAAQRGTKVAETAAHTLALQLHVLRASTDRDADDVFASLAQLGVQALVIEGDAFFTTHSEQLAALTVRNAIPTMYARREFVEAGGLMSYGAGLRDGYRQVGIYTGRILKGEKPADLPVVQSSKFELVINLKTAKALGLDVPLSMLMRVDEVIE
jgi:putative ABC transport system substrate-binding protein